MNKLKKLSLHKLEEEVLADQTMRCLKGGGSCTCGCHYAGSGGSSTGMNDATNFGGDKDSYGGGAESCGCAGSSGVSSSNFWQG